MTFMYIDSKEKLDEFSKFVKSLGIKKKSKVRTVYLYLLRFEYLMTFYFETGGLIK